MTKKLNDVAVYTLMPTARSQGTWSRADSWLRKFFGFARQVARKSGKCRTDKQLLASDNMCRHFITQLARESSNGKGFSRPRSARTALSSYRQRLGFTSLSGNFAVSAVVSGAEAAAPRTKRQAAGLVTPMLKLIIAKWGSSSQWWQEQCTAAFALGFVSIMRLGEICSLRRKGIRVTFKDGSEMDLASLKVMPDVTKLSGMLVHLPWRKNHTTMDCWVPVACATAMGLLLKQECTLRKRGGKTEYLFPSRQWKKSNRQRMHPKNHVSQQSLVRALRKALLECVPTMTARWASLYSGHSLRVGGSNQMRKEGIADDVHRRLGGWMSLQSSQGYMCLSAREQFAYTLKLAKQVKRKSGLSEEQARRALRTLQPIRL